MSAKKTDLVQNRLTDGHPIVVLGMHKSGTTLVADTLHRSGIPMLGAEVTGGYDSGNKMERAETRALNIDLLGGHDAQSLRVTRAISDDAITSEKIAKAHALVETLGSEPWGFKDPRTLLTLQFWQKVLEQPLLIGVFRDPIEVFGHYNRHAGRRWISRDPFLLPDALLAWCTYNQRLLDAKKQHPNMLLLNYTDFMTDDKGMQLLSQYLGRDLVDCRIAKMRRALAIPNRDYRLAKLVVRLRDRLNPDLIHSNLQEAASK